LAADNKQEPPDAKAQPGSANATLPGFPGRITTLDGKTYEKATLERVDPDGLLVAFAPVERGLGSAKLKFRNLPAELRERCGYDPDRALDYETARARGEEIWIAENAAWTEQRRAAQAEEAIRERQLRDEAGLRIAAEAEQARNNAARKADESAYYQAAWWWTGSYCPTARHSRTAQMPQRVHALDCTTPPVSTFIGPMRPFGK